MGLGRAEPFQGPQGAREAAKGAQQRPLFDLFDHVWEPRSEVYCWKVSAVSRFAEVCLGLAAELRPHLGLHSEGASCGGPILEYTAGAAFLRLGLLDAASMPKLFALVPFLSTWARSEQMAI